MENNISKVDSVFNYLKDKEWFDDFYRNLSKKSNVELKSWLEVLEKSNELINTISFAFTWFGAKRGYKFWSEAHSEYQKWYKEQFPENKKFCYKGDDFSSF